MELVGEIYLAMAEKECNLFIKKKSLLLAATLFSANDCNTKLLEEMAEEIINQLSLFRELESKPK